MNIAFSLTNTLLSAACVFCAGNTMIHDTGIDNVAQRALTLGAYSKEAPPPVEIRKPHTHSERVSFYQAVRDRHTAETLARVDSW